MVVRIKLKLKAPTGREITTSALVNSGFEAETPQLLLPRSLAATLGLWPPPPEAQLVEVGTPGGPVRNYLIPGILEVSAVTEDMVVGPVKCDAMISSLEYEVLISDQLGGELGIVILDFRGDWKLMDKNTVRAPDPCSAGSNREDARLALVPAY